MKKITLILLSTLLSTNIFAQELVQPSISNVKKGKTVPFDGMLYNYEADSILQEEINTAEKMCSVRNEYAIKIQQENCSADKKRIQIETNSSLQSQAAQTETCHNDVLTLQSVIKNMTAPVPVTDTSSRHWWILAGIGIGAALTGGSFYLVTKLR